MRESWSIVMLLSGGLFVGGLVTIAWERVPAWRATDLADFRTGFAHTLRRMDHLQPALLVLCLGSTIGFASSAGGAWSRPGRHRGRRTPRRCGPGGLAVT